MALNQPPLSKDHARSSWEYEIVAQFNALESRLQSIANIIDTEEDLDTLETIIEEFNNLKERIEATGTLYIQETQPSGEYVSGGYLWVETKSDGDFSFWFCEE